MIKFVSDLRQVSGFLRVLWFPPPIKLIGMIQYSQKRSVINLCDEHITLLSETDISFGLFKLFTYVDMPFG